MKIEALRVKNFKAFKDIKLTNLPAISVFIGANGTGKTTLFDVFGFLRDALQDNVRVALQKRGGFKEVITRGESGSIEIEIKFSDHDDRSRRSLITYLLIIGLDKNQPVVKREILTYRCDIQSQSWHLLDFSYGKGTVVVNEFNCADQGYIEEREEQAIDSYDNLALKGLSQFQRFKIASSLRKLIENWYIWDFYKGNVGSAQRAISQSEHILPYGENLALVAQYMYENHRPIFKIILEKMAKLIPGFLNVEMTHTQDGRILLMFQDGSFKDPFLAGYVSGGTLKIFAYLLLLHDPNPLALLCVEEPENELYPSLFCGLLEEFRDYADKGGQIMISTHSPDVLNYIKLNEIFCLSKKQGITVIEKASDNTLLVNLINEGDLPGALWKQGLFNGVNPA